MQDFDKTVLSQYSNSAVICQLIDNLNAYIDPNYNLSQFYFLMWNIDTAVGAGLDVWGRIVGVQRVLTISDDTWFGFAEQHESEGWNQGSFWSGQPVTSNFTLLDEAFRRLIFAKAAANITDGSIPAINQILMNLFPNRGNAYVTDGNNAPSGPWFGWAEAHDSEGWDQAPFWGAPGALPASMTMVYTFLFHLEPFEISIVVNSGVLPRSTGVLASASYF